jgi:ribonuclease P protein component
VHATQLVVAARFSLLAAPKAATVCPHPFNTGPGKALEAMGIPASKRLRKPSDFLGVRSEGKRILCGPFIFQCHWHADGADSSRRFGVIASRRVGNAVKRNLGKRIFREIFRQHEAALPQCCDVVVVLRHSFDRHAFADLESRFLRACATSLRESQLPAPIDDN